MCELSPCYSGLFPFPHLLDQNSHPVYNLPLWGSPIKPVLASSATHSSWHSSETHILHTTHFILFPYNTITEPCLFLVLYSVWQLSSLKPQFIRYTKQIDDGMKSAGHLFNAMDGMFKLQIKLAKEYEKYASTHEAKISKMTEYVISSAICLNFL